jgi:hypothetical protein
MGVKVDQLYAVAQRHYPSLQKTSTLARRSGEFRQHIARLRNGIGLQANVRRAREDFLRACSMQHETPASPLPLRVGRNLQEFD